MSATTPQGNRDARRERMRQRLRAALVDVAWGAFWALMLAAAVLFSSGASEFLYVDF